MKFLLICLLLKAASATAALTDAEIAAVLKTAQNASATTGRLAAQKTKRENVRKFAEQMVLDHTHLSRDLENLIRKLALAPKASPLLTIFDKDLATALKTLRTEKSEDFDKVYVDHEAQYQRYLLQEIDKSLLPGAQDPRLRTLLEMIRPYVAAHLEAAENLYYHI